MKKNIYYWIEAEDPIGFQAPETQPDAPQDNPVPQDNPNTTPTQDPNAPKDPNATQDDMQEPEQIETPENEEKDYEAWRHDFMEAAIRCDNEELINFLNSIRDRQLEASQKKFVEDNIQIFMFRRDATVLKASQTVRNSIKKDLDSTNPGTSVMQHLTQALDQNPLLYQGLIKLGGTFAWKADLHRKWLGSLLGAVQVGGGATNKDLVICESDFDINVSTRFVTQFGEINIGKWSLIETDPKEYLKPDELEDLQDDSPELKQVLRRKLIAKAIGETYRKRAFLVHVVSPDGTIYALGWDLGNSILEGYQSGKLVVRGKESDEKEIVIGEDGNIVKVIDYTILFVKETGELDDEGQPESEEVPFLQRRDSILYLVANLETLKAAAASLSGMFFHELPYNGNPSDIQKLQRSVPGLSEIISRQVV